MKQHNWASLVCPQHCKDQQHALGESKRPISPLIGFCSNYLYDWHLVKNGKDWGNWPWECSGQVLPWITRTTQWYHIRMYHLHYQSHNVATKILTLWVHPANWICIFWATSASSLGSSTWENCNVCGCKISASQHDMWAFTITTGPDLAALHKDAAFSGWRNSAKLGRLQMCTTTWSYLSARQQWACTVSSSDWAMQLFDIGRWSGHVTPVGSSTREMFSSSLTPLESKLSTS